MTHRRIEPQAVSKKRQPSSTLNTLLNKATWKVGNKSFTAKDCLLPTLCCSKHQKMVQAPQDQPIHPGDGYDFLIKKYIEDHTTEIFEVIGFKGGWERWLQIELARTMKAEYHRPLLCEESIWPGKRVDLWAKGSRIEEVPNIGIELKCRTALENGLEFANRFHKDLIKIAERPAGENRPCRLYATGLGFRDDVEIEYTNVRDPNTNQPIPIYYDEVVQSLFLIYSWVDYPRA